MQGLGVETRSAVTVPSDHRTSPCIAAPVVNEKCIHHSTEARVNETNLGVGGAAPTSFDLAFIYKAGDRLSSGA
jgi:hypothetical protein